MSSFNLSNIVWNKTETDKHTSCTIGDWTGQNWTKRDGRNNQEEEEQQQQQEKKATYKTAAELAVKNFLGGRLMVLGLEEGLVECATLCSTKWPSSTFKDFQTDIS